MLCDDMNNYFLQAGTFRLRTRTDGGSNNKFCLLIKGLYAKINLLLITEKTKGNQRQFHCSATLKHTCKKQIAVANYETSCTYLTMWALQRPRKTIRQRITKQTRSQRDCVTERHKTTKLRWQLAELTTDFIYYYILKGDGCFVCTICLCQSDPVRRDLCCVVANLDS